MTEWRECKLGDVIVLNYGKALPEKKRVFGNIPVYSSAGLTGYHNESLVNGRGIIIGRKGTIGSVHFSYKPFWCIDTAYYITDNEEYNLKYIYYLLQTLGLNELNEDSAVPGLNRNTAYQQDISFPPLPEQKAIAEVLSSLDDKIDLLTRQNKTLEDIAQAYFRKWFIEDASDEWEIKKLRDFGEIICGKTPPTTNKKFFNGNIPFIKIPDMHNNVYIFDTADTLSEMGAKYQENKFIPPMSICVSCIATVGLVSMNVFLSQTNQQINSLIPKHDKYRYYLFLFLRSYRDELLALGSGGTMTLNINKTLFGDIECYCPDDEILFRFNNVVNPLFGKIYNNCKQIRILSKLRNTLLPKLISGEIRVKM